MGIIEVVHEHYKNLGLSEGRQEGRAQGRAEERLAKDREFVTRLIRAGLDDATIMEYSGTAPEFVSQMREELAKS